jgi:flagellar biosynthesis protein
MPEAEKESSEHKKAVAIRYDKENDSAPRVVAKGAGIVADKIISAATQNSVPIYANKTLSNMLMAVELDREIPPELYHAVAEILAYIFRLDQSRLKL